MHHGVEVAVFPRRIPQLGLERRVLYLDADSLPLVDDKYACRDERLVDGAVYELELEVGVARLQQQAFGLRARFLDVAPEARYLLQLL
jgi:hypothetical protein